MKFKLHIIYMVILGILIGWITYFFLVRNAYSELETEIKSAKIFEDLINNDPALYSLVLKNEYAIKTYDSILTHQKKIPLRILVNLDILTAEDDEQDVGALIETPLLALVSDGTPKEVVEISSLTVLTKVLASLSSKGQNVSAWEQNFHEGVAKCLAKQPMAFENYFDAMINETEVSSSGGMLYLLPREFGGWGQSESSGRLLDFFFTHFRLSHQFIDLNSRVPNGLERQEEYRQLREFLQAIIVSINNNKGVENARNKVVVYHGVMQFFMIVLFFTATFFIVQRVLFNLNVIDISERSQRNLSKFYGWILTTIPIMGFVGTIIGLMRALADADQIPLAVGNINTSLAISQITETLSIAFTTTLMAFVMVIILGIINLSTQYFFKDDLLSSDER